MKTKTIEISDTMLEELEHLTEAKPVIVMREGIPAYAIIPLDEFDYETWALSENEDFMAIIEHSRQRFRQEGGVTLDEVKRQLGLTVDEQ
jgi:PHD/YefM family antitoxin component YafN of YafNO toxin-antitoxin module